jgi:hypothetical protein
LISVPPYLEKMISSPTATAALRLLLRRVRQDDPARRRLLVLEGLDDEAVAQWL